MAGRYEQKEKRLGRVGGILIVLLLTVICIAVICFLDGSKDGRDESAINREFPILEQVELRLENRTLVEVTDPERVREIRELLSAAEDIGYEPKTYILGAELVYIGMDGQAVTLELDLDSDLYRYDGRFFNYGPGNDNNAIPKLWNLLGLKGWPEEVKAAYPEWFASVGEQTVPTNGSYQRQSVYMDLWYPDWYYVKIQEEHALAILEAVRQEEPLAVDREKVAVEDSIYTLHIAYDDGREYDIAIIGEEEFLLWESSTENVYSITSHTLRETVDDMIALSKAQGES